MEEDRQRRTILHELIHIKQFNNSLSNWACEELDASEKLAEKLDGTIWEDVRSIEGETELILSNFFPEEESSYPYAQRRKEKEFKDINLDKELNFSNEEKQILEKYRGIQEQHQENELYIEEGEFNRQDYRITVLGGQEPEQRVKQYLINTFNYNQHTAEPGQTDQKYTGQRTEKPE